MEELLKLEAVSKQDEQIEMIVRQEGGRLRSFIRKRVSNDEQADDILQDVYGQLVEAYRLMHPIDHISGWLFTVARNRITDMFRKKKPDSFSSLGNFEDDEGINLNLADILPSRNSGPEDEYFRQIVMEALQDALAELPEEQQAVFAAHELEGIPFKVLAEESGLTVNTLVSRKRYAVLHLRERLREIYNEMIND